MVRLLQFHREIYSESNIIPTVYLLQEHTVTAPAGILGTPEGPGTPYLIQSLSIPLKVRGADFLSVT